MSMKKISTLLILQFLCICLFGQKNVLFEKFTNAYCGVCPDATLQLIELTNLYPNLIWVSHHKPVSWTDNPLTNETSIALWDHVQVPGVPIGMVDRTQYGNSILVNRNLWAGLINSQSNKSSSFQVNIESVNYDPNTRILEFDVSSEVIEEVVEGSYRITTYVVEDSVNTTEQHSYFNEVAGHPLEGRGKIIWDYYHRNVVREILDNHLGLPDIIPNEPQVGEEYSNTFTYQIPPEYKAHRIKLVAMVSKFDEVNQFPGEVLNATIINLKDLNLDLTNSNDISEIDFKLYPNPASEYIKIHLETIPHQILVVDASGKDQMVLKPSGNQIIIDVQTLVSGNYFIILDYVDYKRGRMIKIVR